MPEKLGESWGSDKTGKTYSALLFSVWPENRYTANYNCKYYYYDYCDCDYYDY